MKIQTKIGITTLLAAVALTAIPMVPAAAGPIQVVEPGLNPFAVDGSIQVVFTFSNAADEDLILSTPTLATNPIIDNQTTPIGTVIDLGSYTGNLTFELDNKFTGASYFSDSLDAFGDYHVKLDADYADFGVGALDAASLASIQALANAGYSIIFMAWEDHDIHSYSSSDWDYNDVIYAIAYKVHLETVPEPLSLSIFGAGLAGAFAFRRRRKSSKN